MIFPFRNLPRNYRPGELAAIHSSTVSRFHNRNFPPMPMSALGNRPDEISRNRVREPIGT
jgi:hypothetical protein